jgi:glutamate synthase domain-containing protein 2
MGADAVAIGQGVLMALGCNSETYVQKGQHLSAVADYGKLRTAPGTVITVTPAAVPSA